jgi:two-component system cell cycle response regulator
MNPAHTRVLVVDDDPGIRFYLRDLLERMGSMEVAEAVDGQSGLQAVRDFHPDLVLLDLMMPGMTGIEVCRRLRADESLRDVPVIVLSAASDNEQMLAAIDAGAEDFLPKPIASAELRAKVRTLSRLNRVRILASERRRLHWLLDRASEAMIVIGPDGLLRFANTRASELLGFFDASVVPVATALSAHFQADPPEAWSALGEGAAADGRRFTLHRAESASAPARWLEVEICIPAESVDGTVLLRIADTTEEVKRRLDTWTFQKLISHKLSTPLNGLGPVLEFLDEVGSFEQDPEAAEMLHVARVSATRLQETISSVLRHHEAVASARKAGPGVSPRREKISSLLATAAANAGFTGPVTWTDGADRVVGGIETLELVLSELLTNYIKFSRANAEGLQAEFAPSGPGRMALRLAGPGPDLPPDVIGQLGRPYVQLEKSFTGEVPGMGLGLATAREMLRWRGGDLRFGPAQLWVGSGLAVWVDLPEGFSA